MAKRNPYFSRLQGGYLFPEITKRKNAFLMEHPDANLINLSIGDTSQPLPAPIAAALEAAARRLGTPEGYEGYGPSQGFLSLRKKIARHFYDSHVSHEDIYISDGAKCDLGRLQMLFDANTTVAVQDPAYPVYVDDAVIFGHSGDYDLNRHKYSRLRYMPCTPDNAFFPDVEALGPVDLIYFCSPNNPTGAVATRSQLERLVAFAKAHNALIIFDTAYAAFIQDTNLPRSIYEIPGADEVAIEVSSFSKIAGFTGVRLGWTVVPEALRFSDGSSVKEDWIRLVNTFFGGACNIVQWGAEALFTSEGTAAVETLIGYYRRNASVLKSALSQAGISVYGGDHAPYLWVPIPGRSSWETFGHFLSAANIVCTPGVGFGPSGEGFVRFSALGSYEDALKAADRFGHIFSMDL